MKMATILAGQEEAKKSQQALSASMQAAMATNSTLKEQPPLIPEADLSDEKTQKDSTASAKE